MVQVIVQIDTRASGEEEAEIRRAFSALGMADVEVYRKDPGIGGAVTHYFWTVIIAAPLAAFLAQLAKNAADDAYPLLKGGVHRGLNSALAAIRALRSRGHGKSGYYILVDTVTGARVILSPDLPDEAYASLSHLDLSAFGARGMQYNRAAQQWEELGGRPARPA